MAGLLLAAQVMAAFRGLPPSGIFSPNAGLPVLVLWYAVPLLVPVVCGTAASALLSIGSTTLAVAVLALLWWAAKPNTTNHAENDEATSRDSFTYDTKETK